MRRLISSYSTAGRGFGRSTRPSRCTYSRVAELPLTKLGDMVGRTAPKGEQGKRKEEAMTLLSEGDFFSNAPGYSYLQRSKKSVSQ